MNTIPMNDRVRDFYNHIGYDHGALARLVLTPLRYLELKSLFRHVEFRSDDKVLDAGCGSGYYTQHLAERSRAVFACDVAEQRLRHVETMVPSVQVFEHDLQQPLPEQGFDKILASGVLEFCEDYELVVRNLLEALVTDGQLVLLIPRKGIVGSLYRLYHNTHDIQVHLFLPDVLSQVCRDLAVVEFVARSSPLIDLVVIRKAGH